ncbi:putative mediator of RNA polymerase II transcription subunit 26 [Frankliniella occidentalis]|uniref:Mediator of RNA polymerase II transcription subunit 26 n=1 Tax=Frankliniella occidentalis TaxID=133901 RepID=A0A9C6XVE8_FRAOC|nr:putative mediator of RNA polymerase II transcription subunit 26 [Frankliniella occidentalis]
MAPEAPRVATRASRAPRSPRGLLAVPWWSLTVLAILVVAATRAAADAEVYQEYARSARDEAAPAAAAPKWPEPDSEDEFVDRISMLMGPSKEGGRDLAAQRLRLSRLREEQEEKERQQQKQQQQQEDSLQKQLQGERASHESPQQQQQQQVRPRPAQETKASAKAPQQQQQRPADDTERQMQLYWQEAARAALAKQQKEAVSKATLARQQEAETKAAQEAAKARQAEAAKAALSKQQEVAAQQEEAKALYAKQQQEEARQAAAAAKAKQEEAVAAAKDEQQLEDLDDAYDIARALTQQPSVPAIDQTLLRTYMRSLGPQVGSVDQVGPIWQRYWDQVLASLSQQGLQQQQQPAVSDLIAELLNDAERQTQQTQQRQREMQWQAQQQQQTQDRQQQMLLQAQHEQMDPSTAQKMLLQQQQTQQQPQQQQQPPFTYTFQKPEQSSRFAINPADPRFWQEDPRLQYLVSRSGGVDGSQPQEDQYDEGSSGVRQALIRSASGLSIPMDLGVSSEQQPDQPDDMVDVDEDLGAVGDDMWLPQQRQQQRQQQGSRVTPPVVPEGIRHQPKPTATRDSRLDDESGRGSNLSNHDYPVVKKQLTFPKDHWFFGMDDVGKLAIFIGASIAVSSMILGFIVWQYR